MKKIFKTIITIIIWLILIFILRYIQGNNNGVGGFYGVIVSSLVVFIILPSIWRKTKIEKLSECGLEREANDLFEAYELDLISKREYEKKIDKLLNNCKNKDEKEETKDYKQIEKDRLNKSLEKLIDLKNKGLIDDKEFEEKKLKLFPKMIDILELEDLVKNYDFDKIDTSIYEKEILNPKIELLDYKKLITILNKNKDYRIDVVFQAYKELKKRLKTTANNS